jgi:hypothetical protein
MAKRLEENKNSNIFICVSAEVHEIPQHGIPYTSAEFSLIPYHIQNVRK